MLVDSDARRLRGDVDDLAAVTACQDEPREVLRAKEWAGRGITVNTVSPTVVLTPMGAAAWEGEKGEAMKKTIPIGRFAYTDEIAAAILFLLSNGSDMITGADIMIDGGYTIC